MKVVITASTPDLSSPVDPRFGRCAYFLVVDTESMKFETQENPHVSSPSGAGIQSAQFIADKGAKALLTGSCGPNAFQTLQAAGVEVIVGVTGTVQEAIQQFKSSRLKSAVQPNVPSHFGLGSGRDSSPAPGGGMGRGMGPGMGYGPSPQIPRIPQSSPGQELQDLKKKAELLRHQIQNITERIKELEKKK